MKRLIYVLLIIFFLGLGVSVQAKTCTVNFFTYFGYDYRDVSYCEASHKLDDYGCYPLTIASILKSYGEDVKPTQVIMLKLML